MCGIRLWLVPVVNTLRTPWHDTRYTRLRDSLGPMVGQTLTIQLQPGWV
jgi:hypothetical protein